MKTLGNTSIFLNAPLDISRIIKINKVKLVGLVYRKIAMEELKETKKHFVLKSHKKSVSLGKNNREKSVPSVNYVFRQDLGRKRSIIPLITHPNKACIIQSNSLRFYIILVKEQKMSQFESIHKS